MSAAVAFVVAAVASLAVTWSVRLCAEGLLIRRTRPRARALAGQPARRGWSPSWGVRLPRPWRGQLDELWPAWLDAAARSARSGATLRDALREASVSFGDTSIGHEIRSFLHDLERGSTLESAVDGLRRPGATADHSLVRGLQLAVRTGGPAAVVLDAVASTLHERAALGREVRALSTQARASAAVMIVAPLLFGVLAGGADRRVLEFFGSGPGALCLLAGLVLDVTGAVWMARIVGAAR